MEPARLTDVPACYRDACAPARKAPALSLNPGCPRRAQPVLYPLSGLLETRTDAVWTPT
jgi:hypothetical protein